MASRSLGDAQLLSPQIKSQDIFDAWVSKLRHHRLYRQNEIVRSPRDATMRTFPPPAAVESPQPTSSGVREAKVSPTTCLLLLTCLLFRMIKINDIGLQLSMKSTYLKSYEHQLCLNNHFWWLSAAFCAVKHGDVREAVRSNSALPFMQHCLGC